MNTDSPTSFDNGTNVANFKSESKAKRWIEFMTGQRMTA